MNDDLMKTQYEHYISEYGKLAAAVRKICPTPIDCDYLVSDDDIMDFMYALKDLGQPLATIKKFSFFSWNDISEFMSGDEFLGYKAWYFTFYDEMKEKGGMDQTLNALDIELKIIRSDKVDKAYIISMLKCVVLRSGKDREMDIELIKREIDLTDNTQMRHKASIMKDFIILRFPNLSPDADIEKEYFADRQSITKITLYERLADKKLPNIKQTSAINSVLT